MPDRSSRVRRRDRPGCPAGPHAGKSVGRGFRGKLSRRGQLRGCGSTRNDPAGPWSHCLYFELFRASPGRRTGSLCGVESGVARVGLRSRRQARCVEYPDQLRSTRIHGNANDASRVRTAQNSNSGRSHLGSLQHAGRGCEIHPSSSRGPSPHLRPGLSIGQPDFLIGIKLKGLDKSCPAS